MSPEFGAYGFVRTPPPPNLGRGSLYSSHSVLCNKWKYPIPKALGLLSHLLSILFTSAINISPNTDWHTLVLVKFHTISFCFWQVPWPELSISDGSEHLKHRVLAMVPPCSLLSTKQAANKPCALWCHTHTKKTSFSWITMTTGSPLQNFLCPSWEFLLLIQIFAKVSCNRIITWGNYWQFLLKLNIHLSKMQQFCYSYSSNRNKLICPLKALLLIDKI